jgi:hypothetical protein
VENISEILAHIDAFIYGREHYNHTRWLMYFGCKPDKLVPPVPSRVYQAIRAATWRATITRGIADNPFAGDDIIPRLHNPGSINTHFPGSYDLVLFFCKGKNIYTTVAQQKNFSAIRQRALWFFFGDNCLPEFTAGDFVPPYSDCKSEKEC